MSNETMIAARFTRWGGPPTLAVVPLPEVAPGQTLVRMTAATVTHFDLTIASGTFGIRPPLPFTGGVEGAGRVITSSSFAPGERVVVRGGDLVTGWEGVWAQYVCLADDALVRAPVDLDDVLAACYFDPCTTAWTALHEVGAVAAGQTVVVGGAAGAIGSLVAQLALQADTARVVGVVSRAERQALLPAGVEPLVVPKGGTADLGELGADLLVDTAGGSRLALLLRAVRPGGRAVVVGYTAGERVDLDLPNWLLSDVSLLPLNMMLREDDALAAAPELAAALAAGRLELRTSRIAFEDIADGVRQLAAGVVSGKLVLDLSADLSLDTR